MMIVFMLNATHVVSQLSPLCCVVIIQSVFMLRVVAPFVHCPWKTLAVPPENGKNVLVVFFERNLMCLSVWIFSVF